jgi:hypothetical protein
VWVVNEQETKMLAHTTCWSKSKPSDTLCRISTAQRRAHVMTPISATKTHSSRTVVNLETCESRQFGCHIYSAPDAGAQSESLPGIILLSDIFGSSTKDHERICERVCDAGFDVFAPHAFVDSAWPDAKQPGSGSQWNEWVHGNGGTFFRASYLSWSDVDQLPVTSAV